jgi:hypothetical protein
VRRLVAALDFNVRFEKKRRLGRRTPNRNHHVSENHQCDRGRFGDLRHKLKSSTFAGRFIRYHPCGLKAAVKDIRVDISAIWPDNSSCAGINLKRSKSGRLGAYRLKDWTMQIRFQIDDSL